ncbi:MAG: AAA family ATPase [Kiritimatiellae bacterium]|nr:AAA family ATPase [Kiritimatiellia bacterium]
MTDDNFVQIFAALDRRLEAIDSSYHRPLYSELDWDDRLICIKGAKGTGKTTMMLQYLKEHPEELKSSIYLSLDSLWLENHSPLEAADWVHANGGGRLFLDEVHYFKPWQRLIKNIYDDYPKIKIVYSGSSMMKLEAGGGDLSRRQRSYELKGLSFREFLAFEGVGEFPHVRLEDVLLNHREIARGILANTPVLPHFRKYLAGGYYPFYKTARSGYLDRIAQIVTETLERDWPETEEVTLPTVKKAKRMLMILSASCPQVPKMNELYAQLETDRNQGLKILYALERAGILALLSSKSADLGNMSRPDKIYCDNPNIMRALSPAVNPGTVRETFFLNQLRSAGHKVTYPPKGDFLVDGRYLFEVGGKGKGFDQIKDIPESFVANDDVETGVGNKIPLWLFGFLY